MIEWISVKDGLPEEYIDVLFFSDNTLTKEKKEAQDKFIWIGKYCNCKGWIKRFPDSHFYFNREGKELSIRNLERIDIQEEITHWMPLPEPPK